MVNANNVSARSILDLGNYVPTVRTIGLREASEGRLCIPVALGARIRRDYNTNILSPVATPATDRYRRRGWIVTLEGVQTGTFYYRRRDGKFQAAGSGYPTPLSQITLEAF